MTAATNQRGGAVANRRGEAENVILFGKTGRNFFVQKLGAH
jgi:hypothetical protein